jgi:hypothetical protein
VRNAFATDDVVIDRARDLLRESATVAAAGGLCGCAGPGGRASRLRTTVVVRGSASRFMREDAGSPGGRAGSTSPGGSSGGVGALAGGDNVTCHVNTRNLHATKAVTGVAVTAGASSCVMRRAPASIPLSLTPHPAPRPLPRPRPVSLTAAFHFAHSGVVAGLTLS